MSKDKRTKLRHQQQQSSNVKRNDCQQQCIDNRDEQKEAKDTSSDEDDLSSTMCENTMFHVATKATESQITLFLIKQLVFCRIFFLVFQCFINRIMKDYPTDAFRGISSLDSTTKINFYDKMVHYLFEGLSRWDARHFLHVAEFGYTWESCLAFFPGFPALLRILGTFLHFVLSPISFQYAMILGGVLFNNTIFVVNGLLLYNLVFQLTKDIKIAIISVYIFCWNPASIFFSTVYSESLYLFFTLSALLFLYQEPNNVINQVVSSIIFSFAFLTRSNGIINIGYIGFNLMLEVILRKSNETDGKPVFEELNLNFLYKICSRIILLAFCFGLIVLPLQAFSFAIEEKFCTTKAVYLDERILNYITHDDTVVLPGNLKNLTWCKDIGLIVVWLQQHIHNSNRSFLMPSYYSHVQDKYWDVGFLKYWQFRKIPFFIIAAPSLCFVFYGVVDILLAIANDSRSFEEVLTDRSLLVPFVIHNLFIALAGVFVYNVETSMRLIFSTSPFIYIVIARIISKQTPHAIAPDDLIEPFLLPFLSIYARVRFLHFMMLSYLLGFFFIGTTLHVNWLPFL